MAFKTVEKFAMTVTNQYNPNIKQRTNWSKPENAIGNNNSVTTAHITKTEYASHYKTVYKKDKNGKEIATKKADKWDYKYEHPYTLSAHDFRLDLPSKAKISKIKFQVKTKSNKKDAPLPDGRFNIYGTAHKEKTDNTKSYGTGWNNGVYYHVKKSNHSTSYNVITYEMDADDVKKADASISHYNTDIFGIDLVYKDTQSKNKNYDATVSVVWVKCIIEYYIPDSFFKITSSDTTKGTRTNPLNILAGQKTRLTASLTNGSSIPYGNIVATFSFEDYTEMTVAPNQWHTYDVATNKWTVNLKGKTTETLKFDFIAKKRGLGVIHVDLSNGNSYDYYYFVNSYEGVNEGYSDIQLLPTTDKFHIHHRDCLNVVATGYSDDDTVSFVIDSFYTDFIGLTLDDNCQNIKEIISQSQDGISVKLNEKGSYVLSFNYCFYPIGNDIEFRIVNSDDPTHKVEETFSVGDAYSYHIAFRTKPIIANSHRVVSDIETNASVIELVSDEVDSHMIVGECTISMDKWDDLDYIGCIPLEHLHFDPKSTYKDTLIDSRYKNKRYMGKKLASDEDITLNVRLHPQQVTTLQGLIDMDKPIPINANHRSFESDALNHRGWAEIYGVKVEETNPHYYKCDIDVKYLTHNLNTRFKIDKGKNVDGYAIPSLMTEVYSSGENISDMDGDSFFKVDTDGTFYYNDESIALEEPFEDDNDNTITVSSNQSATYTIVFGGVTYTFTGITELVEFLESRGYNVATPVVGETLKVVETVTVPVDERNNFNIDNGQHITITTKNPLSHTSVVDFSWLSVLIPEIKENAISRIVRLLNSDNEPVFEYEYDNLQIVDDEVKSDVIYRVLDSNNEWIDYNKSIVFNYEPSEELDSRYGSTLTLELNNGKLSIRDSGFNGRELFIDDIVLPDSSYTYQVEWINNNDDEETNDIDCIFDFRVMDTVLSTTYADKFANLIVSPFPVSDKKILFTRQAEEGTIYYYKDDGEEFSYLVEPYYQYHNGCDLVSSEGVSTVNLLNYGFEIVYIQNGLVRLGFNRLNGEMYIAKYDTSSKSYVTVSNMHLSKFDDVNLNSIDDDKIEIQASDSVFIIYRGHPYVKIKHELEDIILDTTYNTVWAEQVGSDDAVELPSYWDLMNNKNLLPIGVGGKIHSSDLTISSEYVDDRIPTNLEFDTITTTEGGGSDPNFITGYTITATLNDNGGLSNYTDDIELDDSSCSFGLLTWNESCDSNTPSQVTVSTDDILQVGDEITIYGTVSNQCNTGVSGQTVYFYEVYEPYSLDVRSDKSIIQTGESTTITATLHDEDGSLIEGEFVAIVYEDNVDTTGWSIDCALNKSIIQTGETITFTITIKDANNNPVEDVFVGIYEIED